MSDNVTAAQIVSTMGLQAIPESIRRLTELVARQDAPMKDISKVICQDKELTARLLSAANPRASSEDEYTVTTVEAVLMRAGLGCALLLAMGEPLIRAVKRTFNTMIGAELKHVASGTLARLDEEHIISEVAFDGRATGCVNLRISPSCAQAVATSVFGFAPETAAEVDDVIGELSNMVVGNFKSNLCDAGLNCKLSPPKIARTDAFKLHTLGGGLAGRLGFKSPEVELFVDILVNPWND